MNRTLLCLILALAASSAQAESFFRYFCETRLGDVSGAGAAVDTGASALRYAGVRALTHSSGELILSGAAGYIPGTLGAVAGGVAAAPVVATTLGAIGAAGIGCALLPAETPLLPQDNFVPNRFMLRLSGNEVAHIDALREHLRTTENRNLDRRQVALLALARLIALGKAQTPGTELPTPDVLSASSALGRRSAGFFPGASFHVWLPRPAMAELDQLRQKHAQETGQNLNRPQMIAYAVDQYFGLLPH